MSVYPHQSGNNTDYDRIGTTRYPVIITWGYNIGTANTSQAAQGIPPTTLACIKANNTVAGSRVPGVANRPNRMYGWVIVPVLIAAGLAL